MAVGGFNHPDLVEKVLAEGKCDFVAFGRQQFADPACVNKVLTVRTDEIQPCLRCSCFNPLASSSEARPMPKLWTCTVNPWSGRELRMRWAPKPQSSKNVLVVGGGVAGMYAAITAAERGHKVTLAEKENHLGGILQFTENDMHKQDRKMYKDSLITRVKRLGVNVELNTEATPDYIKLKSPDAIICAVGSRPAIPKIKGIEKAIHAVDIYNDFSKLGQKIVMIGGGLIGCETGLLLAEMGKQVHIIEVLDDVAKEGNDSHRRALIPRMKKALTWDVNTRCTEIKDKGVTVQDKDGNEKFIEADTVVYAVGMKAKSDVVDSLRGIVPWFVAVGDCVQPRRVEQAVYEGFAAAMDII